jgi:hypothetical protein
MLPRRRSRRIGTIQRIDRADHEAFIEIASGGCLTA